MINNSSKKSKKFSMANVAKSVIHDLPLNEYGEGREVDMTSDIGNTWFNPEDITKDVLAYLMQEYENSTEDNSKMNADFIDIEDAINAMERGIKEFRKITGV
jgi:hypothetical protein